MLLMGAEGKWYNSEAFHRDCSGLLGAYLWEMALQGRVGGVLQGFEKLQGFQAEFQWLSLPGCPGHFAQVRVTWLGVSECVGDFSKQDPEVLEKN